LGRTNQRWAAARAANAFVSAARTDDGCTGGMVVGDTGGRGDRIFAVPRAEGVRAVAK